MEHEGDGAQLEQVLHRKAAELLDRGMVDEAWKTSRIQRRIRRENGRGILPSFHGI